MKGMKEEYKALARLGAPVLVTQLGVIIVSFADTMMIGAYGTEELASCAFVNSVFTIPVVMLIGFAGGVTPLIGALFTQKRHFEAGRTLRASLEVNILTALALTALMAGFWFCLDLLGQPEELMPLIREYYLIVMASMVPMSVFNCAQQMANGITDTAMPMWIILGANLFNIFGNYCLIFGHFGCPELGLEGAGLATLAARTAGAVAIMAVVLRTRRYRPYLEGLRTRGHLGAQRGVVWKTSYPLMIQGGIECSLWTFGTIVCGWFGKIQLAAYQVIVTLSQIGFMTYLSMATSVAIRVANKNGLRDVEGMNRTAAAGLHLNLVLATLASGIMLAGGKHLLEMFTGDPEVVSAAYLLLVPMVVYQYADACQYVYANAQRGTGVVKPLAVVSVAAYLVIGAASLYLLAVTFGLEAVGVYYSFSIALWTAALMLYLWFRRTLRSIASAA